jgi:hypothetical protein
MKSILFSLILSLTTSGLAQAASKSDSGWLPVSDAEVAMKTPQVEKDAGVEALFWYVHILDGGDGGSGRERTLDHYVRLKVFDEKGKSKAATIQIPYLNRESVSSVEGRTIKPDGTILDLKKDGIFERDQVRLKRFRIKAVSLAMPGVEPGVIVEYRWREIRKGGAAYNLRLEFQLDYPVQKVTYFVRPLRNIVGVMQVRPFNCHPLRAISADGFDSIGLENVPAFRAEPMMPSEPNVRPWALIGYTAAFGIDQDQYWSETGQNSYRQFKSALKANNALKTATAQAIQGASSDNEKAAALIRNIRANVRDVDGNQVSEAERMKILKDVLRRVRPAADILKSGIASTGEMNLLLAAMASTAGLEARPALVADRENVIFAPKLADRSFLPNLDVAINIAGKWKLFDAGARLLPASMVSWREEGMPALLSDPKSPMFIESPISPPDASRVARSGEFRLTGDGELEGDVHICYTGYLAYARRSDTDGDTDARTLEKLKEELNAVFPEAEVSDEKVENATNPEKALKLAYHVKLAGFAQRTGKRLLFKPLFFQIGANPLFSASERRFDIVFPYAWNESDYISIELPTGFKLDNAENPGPFNVGKPGSYNLKMSIVNGAEFVCIRNFVFGDHGIIGFPKQQYLAVKNVFDEVHRRDNVTISLKQIVPAEKLLDEKP